jgi:hypothetical protein
MWYIQQFVVRFIQQYPWCFVFLSVLWIKPHHKLVYVTTQILNNFKFHCYIITHYHPILLYIINPTHNINQNFIFLILYRKCDTVSYNCILVTKTSLWRWQDCWTKHVEEIIINKTHHKIEVHLLIVLIFYKYN